jgi:hypothetical protein
VCRAISITELDNNTLLFLQTETNSLVQCTPKYKIVNEWESMPTDSSLDHLKKTNHYSSKGRFLWFMGSQHAGIFNITKLKNVEISNLFGEKHDFMRCPMALIYSLKNKWILGLSCDTIKNESSLHVVRRSDKPIIEHIYLICAFSWSTCMDLLPDGEHVVIAGTDKRENASKSFVQVIRVEAKSIYSRVKMEITSKLQV